MAQIEKVRPTEQDILLWDLWKSDKPAVKIPKIDRTRLARVGRPMLVYGALALAVMLPLLLPGFILTLDMAFTPDLRMPEHISSSYLFHAALHYLNVLLPADIIQKIMLFAILLLCGMGMHILVRYIQSTKETANEFALWGAYIAGAIYMINPFTYSRFMAGQYAVLLGYALLPFFALALLKFFAVPTLKRSLAAAVWLTVIGVVSVHTIGLAALLVLAALLICAWRFRRHRSITLNAVWLGLIGLVVFVAASGYWLFPLLTGDSNQGQAISQFSASDRQAFATTGGDAIAQLGNVLQLQGFWAEGQGLFLLPQEQLPGWTLVVLAVWIVIGIGIVRLWREHRTLAALLIAAGLMSIVVSVFGAGEARLLAGFREPQKFVGLLALVYAVFAGFGAAGVLAWAKKRSEKIFAVGAVLILLLPVLYTPTMFFGFSGQLSPRHYPADWYEINEWLNQDNSNFRVLSLPWHLYMHYPFAGRVIVNPSEAFFDKPVVASNELEYAGAAPTFPDKTKDMLSNQILPQAKEDPEFAQKLNELDFKYILLAKTYDHEDYKYLNDHPNFQLITETPNLKLFRNKSYE